MKYTYACKKVPLNDSIKDYAEKRVEKLEKYFHRDDASAFVTFTVEKDKLCTVEITIRDGSTLLRAQTTEPDGDMRGAIDAAVSYIERQILKNKTRLAKRLRSDAFPAVPMDDFSVAEESEFHIVRTKRFSVKPMSPRSGARRRRPGAGCTRHRTGRRCAVSSSFGSRGAVSVLSMASGRGPRTWTTSGTTRATGLCSRIPATSRAFVIAATAARLRRK